MHVLVINAFIGYKPLADRYFDTYGDDAYIIYPAWSNGLGKFIDHSSEIREPGRLTPFQQTPLPFLHSFRFRYILYMLLRNGGKKHFIQQMNGVQESRYNPNPFIKVLVTCFD